MVGSASCTARAFPHHRSLLRDRRSLPTGRRHFRRVAGAWPTRAVACPPPGGTHHGDAAGLGGPHRHRHPRHVLAHGAAHPDGRACGTDDETPLAPTRGVHRRGAGRCPVGCERRGRDRPGGLCGARVLVGTNAPHATAQEAVRGVRPGLNRCRDGVVPDLDGPDRVDGAHLRRRLPGSRLPRTRRLLGGRVHPAASSGGIELPAAVDVRWWSTHRPRRGTLVQPLGGRPADRRERRSGGVDDATTELGARHGLVGRPARLHSIPSPAHRRGQSLHHRATPPRGRRAREGAREHPCAQRLRRGRGIGHRRAGGISRVRHHPRWPW